MKGKEHNFLQENGKIDFLAKSNFTNFSVCERSVDFLITIFYVFFVR